MIMLVYKILIVKGLYENTSPLNFRYKDCNAVIKTRALLAEGSLFLCVTQSLMIEPSEGDFQHSK